MPLSDFPRYPLLFGPSPVHPLERLSAHLGGPRIWAKREDCNSGLAFGGNKTRKLEYLVPDALAQGADTLVSIGGVQSNHTRQVAAVAAKLGLKARLVQERWVDWPDPVTDKVGNILLSRIMGADVRLDPAGFGIGFKDELGAGAGGRAARRRHAVRDPGRRVRSPAGRARASSAGPTRWRGRRRELGVFFDTVVVCSVTGSTQAGMIAGFAGQHRPRRVLGIDASAKLDETHAQVGEDRPRHRGPDRAGPRAARRRDHRAATAGPVTSTASRCAPPSTRSRLTGRLEGMIIDPVYEGKSMAGLIDLVRSARSARIQRSSTHTWAASRRSTPTAAPSAPQLAVDRARPGLPSRGPREPRRSRGRHHRAVRARPPRPADGAHPGLLRHHVAGSAPAAVPGRPPGDRPADRERGLVRSTRPGRGRRRHPPGARRVGRRPRPPASSRQRRGRARPGPTWSAGGRSPPALTRQPGRASASWASMTSGNTSCPATSRPPAGRSPST